MKHILLLGAGRSASVLISYLLQNAATQNWTLTIGDMQVDHLKPVLENYAFARIHKSYLVNLNEVVKYKRGKGGSVVISNGKELMVSASRKKDLLSFFE